MLETNYMNCLVSSSTVAIRIPFKLSCHLTMMPYGSWIVNKVLYLTPCGQTQWKLIKIRDVENFHKFGEKIVENVKDCLIWWKFWNWQLWSIIIVVSSCFQVIVHNKLVIKWTFKTDDIKLTWQEKYIIWKSKKNTILK